MVRTVRPAVALIVLTAVMLISASHAKADSSSGGQQTPNATPIPSSLGLDEVDHGQLQAGAGGQLVEPIPPTTIPPSRPDPIPSTSTAPQPLPGCAPGFAYLAASTRTRIYPTFTRNAVGGYDGHDAWFGYDVRGAVPPSGASTGFAPGSFPVTADNIAGHIVGVDLTLGGPNQLTGPSQPNSVYPTDVFGLCDAGAITYEFSFPFVAGDAPPVSPPTNVVAMPPFPLGVNLATSVMGHWRIGSVATLPGPDPTTRTFVHIPTCAWLDSSVPEAPAALHAIKTATYLGYTFFLIYTVTVTPGAVTWDWGDGTHTSSDSAPNAAPPTLPAYDASSQTWSNSCSVFHAYETVAPGRTITATQTFTTAITVAWSDGVTPHSQTVGCDPATRGPCMTAIGAAQGWTSGPHPVDQIEPIPFSPLASL